MWTCPKCGEKLEEQFDSCWRCIAREKASTAASTTLREMAKAFGLGALFEAGFLATMVLLSFVGLRVQCWNLFVIIHYPLLIALEDSESLILLLFAFLVMSAIWAVFLRCSSAAFKAVANKLSFSGRAKVVALCCMGVVPLALVAFKSAERLADKPIPFKKSLEASAVVSANTQLALDLYKELSGEAEVENLFFSPFSISTALGIIYAGAQGQTRANIANAAHFLASDQDVHTGFRELLQRMEGIRHWRKVSLEAANGLWVQQGHVFTDKFLGIAKDSYAATTRTADLAHNGCQAAGEINHWISERTRGRIGAMLTPKDLDQYTRLILCNALYFRGSWKSQFKSSETRATQFHVSPEKTVAVQMMAQKGRFKLTRVGDPPAQVLELPYYGEDLGMVIFLPDEMNGLPDVEAALSIKTLDTWLEQLQGAEAHEAYVHLPRFTTTRTVDLKRVLTSLGLASLFGSDADLSSMDNSQVLYLSDARHQAFVEVNESGTEAAALTLMQAKTKGMSHRFVADHPFIFLIRDRGSGTILFLGRVVNPTP